MRRPLTPAAALALLVLAACGTGAAVGPTPAAGAAAVEPRLPVTVGSADGRRVTVADASRIVPLRGNIAEVVFDLGLGPNVVGRDVSATFPEAADLPLVTRAHDVSAESVLALRPTLVLADTDIGPAEALQRIRDVGVPVVVLPVPTAVDGIGSRVEAIAAAVGVPEEGAALAERIQAELAGVAPDVADGDRPTVAFLYLRGAAGVYLVGGPGSGADSMIAAAGGIDAGTTLGLPDAFTPMTSEALAEAAPDVLLLTTTGLESVGGVDGLAAIAGVGQTPAGRDGRVVTVEDGLLYSFGSRTPGAIRDLAEQLRRAMS